MPPGEPGILPVDRAGALLQLAAAAEQARDYVAAAKAPNTLRAYRADWRHFTGWCAAHGLAALPAAPETVALYLSSLASQRTASTLGRRVSAISQAHQAAGHAEPPTRHAAVRNVLAGIRRTHGTAQVGKAPTLTDDVRAMVATLPSSWRGLRDRALLLLGFAGAFRRSELVGLDVGDVEATRAGLVVTLRRSKTDQEGAGRRIGIPPGAWDATCPVKALERWRAASAIADGPLFRPVSRHGHLGPGRLTDQSVALVVKRAAAAAGLDPSRYAGHSLRAGHATAAAAAGVEERVIQQQTGHRSTAILRRYIREGSLFRANSAAALGL